MAQLSTRKFQIMCNKQMYVKVGKAKRFKNRQNT